VHLRRRVCLTGFLKNISTEENGDAISGESGAAYAVVADG